MTNEIVIKANGAEVRGFVARPQTAGKTPALILVQEWWGVNDHIKDVAQRYAREGFLTIAPDLYDGVVTRDAQEASRLMHALDEKKALGYLKAVVSHLRSSNDVNAVGVTGFCMGGTFALLLPCNEKLDAAVPFYGDVPDESVIAKLSCPLLFIGGGKDDWITVEKMNRLEAALRKYNKQGEVKIYHDAGHAFVNDTRPQAYRPDDANDAWRRAVDFLTRHLGKGQASAR
jgi:carboxymethylenebutenolidase